MAGSSVSSPLIACLDGESHLRSVELHLSSLSSWASCLL